jgi:hypothetical protein
MVAGSVRARALARRRLGTAGIRTLASSGSLTAAIEQLTRSPYGLRVSPAATLAGAQRGIAETLLWHLRVLAGWLPAAGADLLRVFAAGFELANIDEHVRGLDGQPADPPFRLVALATAWPLLAQTASRAELRLALARSAWGDPGGESARDLQLGPRVVWGLRMAAIAEPARPWADSAIALLLARELAGGRTLPARAQQAAGHLLGSAAAAGSLADLAALLRPSAAWVLREVHSAEDLWLAELGWWARVRADGMRLLAGSGFGLQKATGAVAVLGADAAAAIGALEIAARGEASREVLDALA